jgi:hypothetical protein
VKVNLLKLPTELIEVIAREFETEQIRRVRRSWKKFAVSPTRASPPPSSSPTYKAAQREDEHTKTAAYRQHGGSSTMGYWQNFRWTRSTTKATYPAARRNNEEVRESIGSSTGKLKTFLQRLEWEELRQEVGRTWEEGKMETSWNEHNRWI